MQLARGGRACAARPVQRCAAGAVPLPTTRNAQRPRRRRRALAAARAATTAAAPPSGSNNDAPSTAPTKPAPPPPVLTRLRGRGWRAVDGGGALVPLASPGDHALPFAVGLFVAGSDGGAASSSSSPSSTENAELLELHYVVAGSGTMRKRRRRNGGGGGNGNSSGSDGGGGTSGQQRKQTTLSVGDSVIAMAGNAVLESVPGEKPLVTLRALLPLSLATDVGIGGDDGAASPPSPPSFASPQWRQFASSPASELAGVVGDDLARVLLGVADEEEGRLAPPPPPAGLFGGGGGGEVADTPSSSSSSSPSSSSSSSSSSVLKRALLDVGAYKLPQQTNRLALLFGRPEDRAPGLHASLDEEAGVGGGGGEDDEDDEAAGVGGDDGRRQGSPSSSSPSPRPPLCLSFGVEMFEAGHVTPQHVHDTAHELFFVLAGEGGEAVFSMPAAGDADTDAAANNDGGDGWGPEQRVRLSPGDTAVFPPGVRHGLDNVSPSNRLYCVQLMLPNEQFVEFVQGGEAVGLDAADRSCLVMRLGC